MMTFLEKHQTAFDPPSPPSLCFAFFGKSKNSLSFFCRHVNGQKKCVPSDFPAHSKLTPGLYLLTCGCQQKSVYGFSMMISGESPAMLFDLVMTRFESTYNPHLIYDASCLAKEYGYNREVKRLMHLTITTDRFHECNHSTCSAAFKSSEYNSLVKINTEACEQTNHLLRRVAH